MPKIVFGLSIFVLVKFSSCSEKSSKATLGGDLKLIVQVASEVFMKQKVSDVRFVFAQNEDRQFVPGTFILVPHCKVTATLRNLLDLSSPNVYFLKGEELI